MPDHRTPGGPDACPRHVTDLDLTPATLACLHAVGIHHVEELTQTSASRMVELPGFTKGGEVYEIVCALQKHGLGFSEFDARLQTDIDREIFRLRMVEGLTLTAVGERLNIHRHRVRGMLWRHFRVHGEPPAVRERRQRVAEERRAARRAGDPPAAS